MTDRTCGEPGCAKPHRARGLCSTHYNLRSKTQRVKRPIPCAACGTIVFKQPDSSRASVCSISCRYVVQFGRRYADRRQLTRWIPERRTAPPTTVVNSNLGTLTSTRCRSCRAWFVDHCRGKYRPALCCSTTCAKRWKRRHRRKFWVPDWFRLAIYDRDHWTCQLCKLPVDPDLDTQDAWAASLDHIIPQAHGGQHTRQNLRLTHRHCNSIRSDAQIDDTWFISPSA